MNSEFQIDLTDAEWLALIDAQSDDSQLPACCANVSNMRESIEGVLREGKRLVGYMVYVALLEIEAFERSHDVSPSASPALVKYIAQVKAAAASYNRKDAPDPETVLIMVRIDNTANTLTQQEWSGYLHRSRELMSWQGEIQSEAHSLPNEPWQYCEWVFAIQPFYVADLQEELRRLAGRYRQEHVSWSVVQTTLLPAIAPVKTHTHRTEPLTAEGKE